MKKKKKLYEPDKSNPFVQAMLNCKRENVRKQLQPFEKLDGMAKADFSKVDEFVTKLQEAGLQVSSDIKGDCEPIVYSPKDRKIRHIGIRAGCYFSLERERDGKIRYQRVMNDDELEEEIQALILQAKEIDEQPTTSNGTKKVKEKSNGKTNHTTTVDALKLRVERLDKSCNAINVKNLTEDMRGYCEGEGWKIMPDDAGGYNIVVREINDND